MQKSIEYTIPYREDGEQKYYRITVAFISNWVLKEYDKMLAAIRRVSDAYNEIQKIADKIVELKKAKADGYKEEVEELKEKIQELSESIKEFGNNDFFQKRFDLILQILEDNGCRDQKLLSIEFWDRKVDASVLMDMLATVVYKDIIGDGKQTKKKRAGTRSTKTSFWQR